MWILTGQFEAKSLYLKNPEAITGVTKATIIVTMNASVRLREFISSMTPKEKNSAEKNTG